MFFLSGFILYSKLLILDSAGGLAQLARAPALHAGGQRFESVILHFFMIVFIDLSMFDYKQRSLT